jgi:hypothetical protein
MYCVSVGLNGSSDDLQQSRSDNHEQEETNYNRADSEGALFLGANRDVSSFFNIFVELLALLS